MKYDFEKDMKNSVVLSCLIAVVGFGTAWSGGTVSNVKARQRYPWNGKVDIDCTLSGAAGTKYSLMVNARDKVGGTNLTVKAVSVEGETATGNPVSVTSGVYRLVWDAEADLPVGFRGEKISISVSAGEPAKKYMIVDLHSGAITYQADVPDGGWTDEPYKTTKMAFQRIEPATFWQVCAGKYGRWVKLTRPYYIGIHSVTRGHLETLGVWGSGVWYLRAPSEPGFVSSAFESPSLPNSYTALSAAGSYMTYMRGNEDWPKSGHAVAATSPVGVLRIRSGNDKFDLPTEAQLSLAVRMMDVADNGLGCLDGWVRDLGDAPVVDPMGPMPISSGSSCNFTCGHSAINIDGSHRFDFAASVGVRLCLHDAD